MPELQLGFNGTFALKKEDVIKIIRAATEEKGLNDTRQGLIDRTGLGNEKVLRIKSWAIRSGLISSNRLSPEGEIVWRLDSYLESNITDWLMHFYLSFGDKGLQPPPKTPANWGGWSYFVYVFLPCYNTFTINELLHHSASVFEEATSERLTDKFRIVLKAYIGLSPKNEQAPLQSCKFIQKLEADKFVAGNASIPNPYMIGYLLAKLWERDFRDTTSVLTNDVLQQRMGLAPALGIDSEALQKHLDTLEAFAIIEQRRTVSPAQIIRRWDNPLSLLEKAYAND